MTRSGRDHAGFASDRPVAADAAYRHEGSRRPTHYRRPYPAAQAGRKPLRERDPELEAALDALIDPDVRGDPESPLRRTCKSTGQLALALTRGGHPVNATRVGLMLKEQGYSLQANVKTKEGAQHPDRDAQFRYGVSDQAKPAGTDQVKTSH